MDPSPTPPLTLLVLAAGIGRRFGGLKQLEGFGPNGEPLLDYAVYDAVQAGFSRLVFVIRPEMKTAFEATLGTRFAQHAEVSTVYQRPDDVPVGARPRVVRTRPWGTGQAVWSARNAVHGPFAVINADDLYGPAALKDMAFFLGAQAPDARDYALVAFDLGRTLSAAGAVSRGICRCGSDQHLLEIVEVPRIAAQDGCIQGESETGESRRLAPDTPVSMNLWGFTPSLFPLLEARFSDFLAQAAEDPDREFFLPQAIDALLRSGEVRVRVLRTSEPWIGVTYPQDRAVVAQALAGWVRSGRYPASLWSG